MKNILTSLFGFATVVSCTSPNAAKLNQASEIISMEQSINDFSFRFAEALVQQDAFRDKNLFVSPASISTAFGVTYLGARGDTASELKQVLSYPSLPDVVGPEFARFINQSNAEKVLAGYDFKIVNSMWGQEDLIWTPQYKDSVKASFLSDFTSVNFKEASNHASIVDQVNQWCQDSTKGRVTNILSPVDLTVNTAFLVTNAVSFNGEWVYPFVNPGDQVDRKDSFTLSSGDISKPVFMKHRNAIQGVNFAETAKYQMVELPYDSLDPNRELVMDIVLPKALDGKLVAAQFLAQSDFNDLLADRKILGGEQKPTTMVKVSLPKWKVESPALNLSTFAKESLGMHVSFDANKADFSGMTGSTGLALDLLLHKTFIQVDELGTEAAAASVVGGAYRGAPGEQTEIIDFNVNRPFFYVIRDAKRNVILFLGRMMDPTVRQ